MGNGNSGMTAGYSRDKGEITKEGDPSKFMPQEDRGEKEVILSCRQGLPA